MLRLPKNQDERNLIIRQALASACNVIIAVKLKELRVINKLHVLQEAKVYCENLSISFNDESICHAFELAWEENRSFSQSNGDYLALLAKDEDDLRDHKRFHNYVITIITQLNNSCEEVSFADAIKSAGIRGENKTSVFKLAFEYLMTMLVE